MEEHYVIQNNYYIQLQQHALFRRNWNTETYPAHNSTIEARQMCSIVHNLLLNNPAQTL